MADDYLRRGRFGGSRDLVTAENPKQPLLTQSDASHPQLSVSLAHEINNPLQTLVNLLHLMEADQGLSEETRRYLILAGDEAQRVSRIARAAMNNLHDSGAPQKISVPNLVGSVVAFYLSRFRSRGIAVNVSYRTTTDSLVRAGQLRQAFSSLLLNAADALPAGGIVQVRVSHAIEGSGQQRHGVRVTVADNGLGIDVADLARIAVPFFTTKGSDGTGLGLALVQDVVRRHGGTLRVRSSTKSGRSGTIFQMFLPDT